jgi:hypothetical protein
MVATSSLRLCGCNVIAGMTTWSSRNPNVKGKNPLPGTTDVFHLSGSHSHTSGNASQVATLSRTFLSKHFSGPLPSVLNVELVLRHFHRHRYQTSPLWFIIGGTKALVRLSRINTR